MYTALALQQVLAGTPTSTKPASLECGFTTSIELTTTIYYQLLSYVNQCICIDKHVVLCNLNYPDLVYLDPRLFGLAGDQEIRYLTCTEDMANDLLWMWSQVEQ